MSEAEARSRFEQQFSTYTVYWGCNNCGAQNVKGSKNCRDCRKLFAGEKQ